MFTSLCTQGSKRGKKDSEVSLRQVGAILQLGHKRQRRASYCTAGHLMGLRAVPRNGSVGHTRLCVYGMMTERPQRSVQGISFLDINKMRFVYFPYVPHVKDISETAGSVVMMMIEVIYNARGW